MPRRSRATGVGRGNGAGSARTQFKEGMPSGNPRGRPRKAQEEPPQSMLEALGQALRQPTEMRDANGNRKAVTMFTAMTEVLLNDFPKASPAIRLRIFNMLLAHSCSIPLAPPPQPEPATVEALVERLAKHYRRSHEEPVAVE